ncbi:PREDICTED: odorant receptor 63a-like isoform X2 [Vollenhovia emeryi]|uniref:odorant receptor 63a-like isoform X2 n=1 Tax=Vollenhovia emeryi TaxID=411798 RepID=UPI0005F523ED|nr:PREDICTED: odorant receptor 63a-like isoform X2 [Vollenhovia emeryi]
MDFQNVNPLNVRLNALSGNLLPLKPDDSQFPVIWKVYSILVWLIEIVLTIVLIPGLFLVSREKALQDGTVLSVVTIEVFFMATRIHSHRQLMNQLIQKLNDILRLADGTMKSIVTTTLQPMENPLKFYWLSGWFGVFLWACLPFLLISKEVSFFYESYRTPAIFSKQPFSLDVFLLGSIFILIGNMYIFVKKVGLDVYMIHLVLLITAQYRYIATKLAIIFRDGNPLSEFDESRQTYCSGIDRWVEKEMITLCRHHNTVIHMIYVNSVLRFCFIGVMLSTVLSITIPEALSIVMYACGSIVQFYMLCSCVQQLLDASQQITNKAFHEKWYQFGPSVQRTFMLMILANNLECKLSTCNKFNLSLPSFMTILNQSYSIALLLLRVHE